MTERLYYGDSYLTEFDAAVVESADDGRRVYLDRTAFYPASGGQPYDTGQLDRSRVVEVEDEGDRIAHVMDSPVTTGPVRGSVDWARRFDHMQQHTGQHLLSAVLAGRFGLSTLSFHLGDEASTIDLDTPSVDAATLEKAEQVANEEVVRNRSVIVSFEEAESAAGLRKATGRSGTLRIVTIEGLDRSACGGTHVRATGEIGCLLLRRTEKIRQSTRVEFVCGGRAVRSARAGFDALKTQGATFQERIGNLEKERRRLATELSGYRGRELYQQTAPGLDGLRRALRRVTEIDESVRAEAQAFTQGPKAVYLAAAKDSVLLAVSTDSGLNAGATVKQIATRGGGSPTMAQGSVADVEAAIRTLYFA